MTKNKEQYCSPTTKTFVVRFEGCLCGSPGDYQSNGTRKGNVLNVSDYDFDSWE